MHYKSERAGDVDDEKQSDRRSLLDDVAGRDREIVADFIGRYVDAEGPTCDHDS